MNKKIAFLLGVVVGGAAGAVTSWRLAKNHYKKIADEEIESIKEWYRSMYKEDTPEVEETESEPEPDKEIEEMKRLRVEYNEIAKRYDAAGVATVTSTHPYVISPEEFGEKEDYDTITLSYYADGVLAQYATDELVEEVDALVGTDSLTTFGEFEDDTVYVRNDANKTDYEIIRDTSKYAEIKREVYIDKDEE